jgi:hypothetical protein
MGHAWGIGLIANMLQYACHVKVPVSTQHHIALLMVVVCLPLEAAYLVGVFVVNLATHHTPLCYISANIKHKYIHYCYRVMECSG